MRQRAINRHAVVVAHSTPPSACAVPPIRIHLKSYNSRCGHAMRLATLSRSVGLDQSINQSNVEILMLRNSNAITEKIYRVDVHSLRWIQKIMIMDRLVGWLID